MKKITNIVLMVVCLSLISSCCDGEATTDNSMDKDKTEGRAPAFSHLPGVYNEDFFITLTTEDENGIIYYTLDGSEPTTDSNLYNLTIPIEGDGSEFLVKAVTIFGDDESSRIVTSFYRINYGYDENFQEAYLDINQYSNAIIGTWIGYVETQWLPPYNVHITFYSSGRYSALALSDVNGSRPPAFYYGTDLDSPNKTYLIKDINQIGRANGTIVICYSTDTNGTEIYSELENIIFNESLDVLKFDFFYNDRNTPLKYTLVRRN